MARLCKLEQDMFDGGMWIIFLEMALVLALAAFIVWWTWPRAKKPEDRTANKDSGKPGPQP